MRNKINFLHDSMHHCSGYQEFLQKKRIGKYYQWNWQYFFLSPIWLINHKMYKEFFVLNFFYLSLTTIFMAAFTKSELFLPVSASIYSACHFFFSLVSHNVYYLQLEQKFYKVKYDPIKCEKIARPYPFYITIPLLFIVPLVTIVCYNIVYSLGK
jgi:hypothetical protein